MKVTVNLLTTYKLGLPDLCLFDKNTHTYKTLTLRYFLIVQEASFFSIIMMIIFYKLTITH